MFSDFFPSFLPRPPVRRTSRRCRFRANRRHFRKRKRTPAAAAVAVMWPSVVQGRIERFLVTDRRPTIDREDFTNPKRFLCYNRDLCAAPRLVSTVYATARPIRNGPIRAKNADKPLPRLDSVPGAGRHRDLAKTRLAGGVVIERRKRSENLSYTKSMFIRGTSTPANPAVHSSRVRVWSRNRGADRLLDRRRRRRLPV